MDVVVRATYTKHRWANITRRIRTVAGDFKNSWVPRLPARIDIPKCTRRIVTTWLSFARLHFAQTRADGSALDLSPSNSPLKTQAIRSEPSPYEAKLCHWGLGPKVVSDIEDRNCIIRPIDIAMLASSGTPQSFTARLKRTAL